MRRNIPKNIKELILWSQKGRCLLCDFPLTIHCHLHHIIPLKQKGPDHYYNMLGLCPNHHGMLETMKRNKRGNIPNIQTKNDRKKTYKFLMSSEQSKELIADNKDLFNLLWSDYGDIGLNHNSGDVNYSLGLASIIIKKDIEILKSINIYRKRIHYIESYFENKSEIYELYYLLNDEIQKSIDEVVSSKIPFLSDDIYDIAVSEHLIKLEFPASVLNNNNIVFNFPNIGPLTIREIVNHKVNE